MSTLSSFPGYPIGATRPLMRPEGKGTSGVLAIGEALGENEERDQLPFRPYAEAGSVLERALFRAGVPRDSLTLANMVWYRPPKNWLDGAPWEMEAIRACRPLLDQVVADVQPKCILALGGVAFRELTGMMGKKQGILLCRGFTVPGLQYPGIPVVGTYHPSLLRRGSKGRSKEAPESKVVAAGGGTQGMALLGVLIRDIQLAVQVARDGAKPFKAEEYRLGASLDEWRDALAYLMGRPDLPIAYDLETWDSFEQDDESELNVLARKITQAQISWKVGQALVSPWTPDLLPIYRAILELPNTKLDWNGRKFDRPILRDHEIRTDLGVWEDLMDLWHHSQPDLPRGLQYAASFVCPEVGPWKHQSASDPLLYGALDVDMPQRIYASLKLGMGLTKEPHSNVSLWTGYQDQVVRLSPVLDRMSDRGMPVTEPKRLALSAEFESTQSHIGETLQAEVPEEIRNVEPKEGYKRKTKGLPKACIEAAGQADLFGAASGGSRGDDIATGGHSVPSRRGDRIVTEDGTVYVTRTFRDAITKLPVERWARLLPFLPGSPDQVKAYLRHQGYDCPRSPKTDKESTEELSLRKLIKRHGDVVLQHVLDYREIAKAKSTYVDGWRPGPDGRVHSTFGYKPATGQLSSEQPNAQNFPKHAKIARAMRRMIEARPGHHLVSFDWHSFHVLTTGFEAGCPLYVRLARLDMHSFFAATGVLRLDSPERLLDLDDLGLMDKLSWYRKQPKVYPAYACTGHPAGMTFSEIRDEKAKRTILGVGFGQGARGMFLRNPESFASTKDAQGCLSELNGVFPVPERWRGLVRAEADSHHRLLTRYGYQRWFWDVYSRRPQAANAEPLRGQTSYQSTSGQRWTLGPGDDHEACVAYRPANDAFGIKRAVMVELGERGLDERFGLVDEVHDDLVFECPDSKLDECLPMVKSLMERPSPYLVDSQVAPDGLWCGVDVALGRNWDKKDSENPEGMEKVNV